MATASQPQGPFTDTVDGAAGVPEVARRLHRPGVVHRHQRDAVPGVEVRRSRLVQDLVPAARSVGHVVRRRRPTPPRCWCRTSPGRPGPSRPRTWSRRAGTTTSSSRATTGTAPTTRSASPRAPGPLGSVHRRHTESRSSRAGTGVAGPGGESVFADTSRELLDRLPRLGARCGGIPQQPRPLPPPPHVLRPDARCRVRLTTSGLAPQRPAASASARRAIPGASRAAHSPAKSSVGPCQRSSSTSPSSERSIRNVASSLKSRRRHDPPAGRRQLGGAAHVDIPVAGVRRDLLDVVPSGQDGGGRLGPPARQSGEPVRAVTDERQVVGDGGRADPELGGDPTLVDHHVLAPVELHDAGPAHALARGPCRACR